MNADERLDRLIQNLLMGAVRDGSHNMVLALLGEGADPRRGSLIVEAASYGHNEIVRILLHEGVDVQTANDSAICAAAHNGHADVVRTLLAAGADFTVHGHGPLCSAEANGHDDVAGILRRAGSYNPEVPGDSPAEQFRAEVFKGSEP